MTLEEKLAQAFKETFEERTERLMKVEKKHRFSLAYRLWERKMLRDIKKNRISEHWTLKRARTLIASGMISATLLIGGTAFAAVSLGRYSFENKPDYSKMLIAAYPSDKTEIKEYYGLPEEDGWILQDCDIAYAVTLLNYTRGEKSVSFSQNLIDDGNIGNINTEKADVEMLSLYSENDGFILDFAEKGILLYWIYDGYLFEISGNLTKNEAIDLVHSTKVIDLTKNFKKAVTLGRSISLLFIEKGKLGVLVREGGNHAQGHFTSDGSVDVLFDAHDGKLADYARERCTAVLRHGKQCHVEALHKRIDRYVRMQGDRRHDRG